MVRKHLSILASTIILAWVLLIATPVHAKGFFLITYGESITHVQDLSPGVEALLKDEIGTGAAIGYRYEAFGMFWLDIWTWDGEFVLYRDNQYWELDAEQLAAVAGVDSIDELSKPWQYSIPPGLLIVLALIGAIIYFVVKKHRREQHLQALFDDERYQRALSLMAPEDEGEEPKSYEEAVDYLVSEGVPRDEAGPNLSAMLVTIAEMQHGEVAG